MAFTASSLQSEHTMEKGMSDIHYMGEALRLSREAFTRGDWPVAAVVVKSGKIVGAGQNEQVTRADVTWHAEIAAVRDAMARLAATELTGCTIYATMEPCPMCAWALRLARIERMVLALRHATLRRTDLGSYSLESFGRMVGWRFELTTGVLEAEYLALRREWGRDQVAK
jgi:tRNA(adenine34) deaminase